MRMDTTTDNIAIQLRDGPRRDSVASHDVVVNESRPRVSRRLSTPPLPIVLGGLRIGIGDGTALHYAGFDTPRALDNDSVRPQQTPGVEPHTIGLGS